MTALWSQRLGGLGLAVAPDLGTVVLLGAVLAGAGHVRDRLNKRGSLLASVVAQAVAEADDAGGTLNVLNQVQVDDNNHPAFLDDKVVTVEPDLKHQKGLCEWDKWGRASWVAQCVTDLGEAIGA